MIFVIADDNLLSIYDSESELQGACEGIDVEKGVYQFFDDAGKPLEAKFINPNEKKDNWTIRMGNFWHIHTCANYR